MQEFYESVVDDEHVLCDLLPFFSRPVEYFMCYVKTLGLKDYERLSEEVIFSLTSYFLTRYFLFILSELNDPDLFNHTDYFIIFNSLPLLSYRI